ncbi:hypothetical protein ACFLZV_01010 [Candidatus Margulisiibacteriota bacterium]
MRKTWRRNIGLVLLLVSVLFMSACGTNIFKDMVSQPEEKDVQKILENAVTKEDYQKALEIVEEVIQDVNATKEEKQEAYASKGKATLGASGVSALEIFANFGELAQKAADAEKPTANIFNLIDLGDATLADIALAADSLNTANLLSITTISFFSDEYVLLNTSPNLAPSLNANEQLLRGIANALVVLMIMQNVYEIDPAGEVSPNAGYEAPVAQLNALMAPPGVSNSIAFYGIAAIDGFAAADVFSDDQLDEISKLREGGDKIQHLYNAKQAGGSGATAYYYPSPPAVPEYGPYDLTDETDGGGLEQALKAIIRSLNI